eukprot:COSAG06_NODE_1073_length_10819_cov_4.311847_3_plen_61_part_00
MYACYPCWIGSGFAVMYFVSFVFFAMFILLVSAHVCPFQQTVVFRASFKCLSPVVHCQIC